MVRAILEGRKTMTRRVLKPQPVWDNGAIGIEDKQGKWIFAANTEKGFADDLLRSAFRTRYQVGDRLWVREAWRTMTFYDDVKPSDLGGEESIRYECDKTQEDWGWAPSVNFGRLRPGMFMPRWASRITLEVTGVKVERLQDISEEDAKAEGAHMPRALTEDDGETYVDGFEEIWTTINGPSSWEANPWVAAYSFKRLP